MDGSGKYLLSELTQAPKENHLLSLVQILSFSVGMRLNEGVGGGCEAR